MSKAPMINWRWDGEAMVPEGQFARRKADEAFVVGERYKMTVEDVRSWVSHQHQFAWLHEAFLNLPERYAIEPWAQSPEALRKYALIRGGFAHAQVFACRSKAEAKRWGANLRPLDEFTIVIVKGTVVTRYTAMSQSMQAMGGKEFQRSKTYVLDFVASLIDVAPAELEARGEAA